LVTTTQARWLSNSLESTASLLRLGQGEQVADLGVPEHLHPLGMEVLGEAGEGETGLLNAARADRVFEAFVAGDQLELQVVLLVSEQARDGNLKSGRHRTIVPRSALRST
jgi:hypothetical protein